MSSHPGSILLERNWDPNILPDGYWVAATAKGILEYSPTLNNLYMAILHIGVPFEDVTVAYVWFGDIQ